MGTPTLRNLIRASGYSGVAGQSFRNNVLGAATGVKLSDYLCFGWSFSGLPTLPGEAADYASGTTFTLGVTFSEHSMANYIRRLGNTVSVTSAAGPGVGFGVSTSTDITTAGGNVVFTITTQFEPGTNINSSDAHIPGYAPGADPGDTLPHDVTFEVIGTGSPGGSGTYYDYVISLDYTIDTGGFNGALNEELTIRMTDRPSSLSDYDVEWYADAAMTTYLGSGTAVTRTQSYCGQDTAESGWAAYERHRLTGTSTWSTPFQVGFNDPRAVT